MGKCSIHKTQLLIETVEASDCGIVCLPPYSPDFAYRGRFRSDKSSSLPRQGLLRGRFNRRAAPSLGWTSRRCCSTRSLP
ncbi:hypothetical protein BJY59DRAFT_400819 [Rhodotorula toruloides]